MISAEKTASKKIKALVDAAERLAALQFQAGLSAGKPSEAKLKPKLEKAWHEFQLVSDSLMATKFIIQENGRPITLDTKGQEDA